MTHRTGPRRLIELVGLPTLITLAVALPVPLAGELPDPLATHWDAGGQPNGSMHRTALWLGVMGLWLGLWALLAWLSRRDDARRGARMPGAIAILAAGGLLGGAMIATAIANTGEADWRAASASLTALLVPIYASASFAAAVAWWCERDRPWAATEQRPAARATVDLGGRERAVWIGRAQSPRMLVGGVLLAAVLAGFALLTGPPGAWVTATVGIATAVAVIWASEVRVTVTAAGVRVAFGPLNAPSRFIALDQIENAEAIHVEPMRWGGWGYRWAGRGRTGVIVRRGPGMLIRLRDGRRLAVTLDGATQAAGLVNDLLDRRT